ncbi:hypothetical protein AK812_SmicGene43922 [Symbiodinium microadriaticum]|uniref:Uncharacterized protein n=1 Tax=Symbiodinium microadriaticum TaxID=2951 RepID=A0A1Q9BZS9_SYMMI|nr:hypothetical protein AK812_SmicGene43922 [Symbiodinium microadriaticum]CAE7879418.1 unnamed protein product [Symbiodinium microadriaticum]
MTESGLNELRSRAGATASDQMSRSSAAFAKLEARATRVHRLPETSAGSSDCADCSFAALSASKAMQSEAAPGRAMRCRGQQTGFGRCDNLCR